jgi:hypothetical protein
MRLKARQSNYQLPKNVTPRHIYLRVGKIDYLLQQISCPRDLDKFKKIEPYPAFWFFENPWDNEPARIHILPAPAKAWKLVVAAETWVTL